MAMRRAGEEPCAWTSRWLWYFFRHGTLVLEFQSFVSSRYTSMQFPRCNVTNTGVEAHPHTGTAEQNVYSYIEKWFSR